MIQCKTLLRRFGLLVAVLGALTATFLAADFPAADTPKALYGAMEQAIRDQKPVFSIAYTGDADADGLLPSDGMPSLGMLLRQMGAQSPDGADNADYPSLNIFEGKVDYRDQAFHFELRYLATPQELAEISRRAKKIVDGFDLSGETDYTKVKLLYEYVGTHYVYDDSLTKFSAYDGLTTGTMVCQGYALLLYRVMWEAGIPCRTITGTSGGENHAWNIVKLEDVWYNLDATWDSAAEIGGAMSWTFFLKSMEDFTGHTRFSPYTTREFEAAHPMSAKSWELPQIKVSVVGGESVGGLIIRKGVEVQLEAKLPTGILASEVQWVSKDPALVTVTADGRVSANTLGATRITVEVVGNRGIISANLSVSTVDLTGASPWAAETVTAYYLNQLLPSTLCADFRQAITRGELARLLNQFVVKTSDYPSFSYSNTFEDIDKTGDTWAISNTVAVGILSGISPTQFGPELSVTRQQAAKALVALTEFLEDTKHPTTGDLGSYADAGEISPWAAPYVAAATELGILQGSEGQFQPHREITLEQMILALNRVYLRWDAAQPADRAA